MGVDEMDPSSLTSGEVRLVMRLAWGHRTTVRDARDLLGHGSTRTTLDHLRRLRAAGWVGWTDGARGTLHTALRVVA